ncbi:caspase family protein [Streptomyces sp. NPDC046374]|uniref:caspase family protein n=1 Tax=Streptomyces sp. NPDC046374 TaxID=3154917 RepID=UPI0033CAE520
MSEPSYRALLIGVPSYKDALIPDLPFIEDDLTELSGALERVGYAVEVHDADQTGRDDIESAVEIFFQEAKPDQTLLVFVSGHGIHHADKDYLIPRGALTRMHDFPAKCVPIDFGSYAERSEAGDIVVFVDACREGIDLREKGVGNTRNWSDVRVRRVGDRHYCHVYACSKGETASYATAGQSTFSLFSRALSTLIVDRTGPSTLGELQERLQPALDQLTSEHDRHRQRVRVQTETDIDAFVLFPRPDRAAPLAPGESPWAALAREHPAWQQVEGGPGADVLQEATARLAHHLYATSAADRDRLKDDPWSVPGFAERMTERVAWLLSKVVDPKRLLLSPAEAALLVAVPFLYAAYGSRSAADALDVLPLHLDRAPDPSPARAAYEDHIANHSRLTRRAARAAADDPADAAGIAWWLFHRWLDRRPPTLQGDALTELTAPLRTPCAPTAPIERLVSEVFEPARLMALIRGLRAVPDIAAKRPVRPIAGSSDVEQRVREQLVFALLTVAHRSAIDPLMLGDVVVDHVGISYAVDLAGMHHTLDKAGWDPHGRTRVLRATCEHPAVGLALQQQAASLDGVLGTIDVLASTEPQLDALYGLPAHATADQVLAALTPEGKRVYESTDLRFRLADDRVQELLMGEELYGDPALAIRELYQNALDACRYRDARTAYLRATSPGYATPWTGSITFVQGVEGGRAYIECTDDGVGMGERELREVFSHAGMRFADLPEYVEELAKWRSQGIDMHPNSRFGIGVLSYFMIADDIRVTTCRLDREGHPGQRLRVDIAGPGALFRIQDLGRGHGAGTTVRLYLRDPANAPSAKELLRRLLWVSDFRVRAEDVREGADGDPLVWLPGELSEAAPLGTTDPFGGTAVRDHDAAVVETSDRAVWWCGSMGAVLADGLWCGEPYFGAVVNLAGAKAPSLTVDRKRCLSFDVGHVHGVLTRQIPALLGAEGAVLSPEWLTRLMHHTSAELADAVLAQAIDADYQPWGVHHHVGAVAAIGCFAPDTLLFEAQATNSWPTPRRLEDHSRLTEWRVLAWAKAGAYPGVSVTAPDEVLVAQPLDYTLLVPSRWAPQADTPLNISSPRLYNSLQILQSTLTAARDHGITPAAAAQRLQELGFRLHPAITLPDSASPEDIDVLEALDEGLDEPFKAGQAVPPSAVLSIARRLRCRPEEAAARLGAFGMRLPHWFRVPDSLEQEDIAVVRRCGSTATMPLAGVIQAAQSTGRRPSELVTRLEALGGTMPLLSIDIDTVDEVDLRLMSSDLDGSPPWLAVEAPVPWGHVLLAAERLGRRPQAIAERLTGLGFQCTAPSSTVQERRSQDLLILSEHGDSSRPWVDAERVSVSQAILAATRSGLMAEEVIARWRELGVPVPEDLALPSLAHPDDTLLLSRDLDRKEPWLNTGQPVALGHVLTAATMAGRPPHDVRDRLAALGYHLPSATPLPVEAHPADARLLSVPHVTRRIWLTPDQPTTLAHIVHAAATTGLTPPEVAARLVELGYTLPPGVAFDPVPAPRPHRSSGGPV